ncbi:MAG: ComF family protein [Firmicutes bacterium]|nr:ComF family protein [Bacillota bacterium]
MSERLKIWGLALLKKIHPAKTAGLLLDFIYPENLYCSCCGDAIDRKTRIHSLCDKCIKKITWVSDNPYESSMDDMAFDELYTCCIYGYYPRQMIQKLKFGEGRYLAKPLGKLMAERVLLSFGGDREKLKKSYDLVSFVPMAKEKQSGRGYNQAKLLAKSMAKELDLPMEDLLEKPKETPSMRLADKYERRTMLKGAFKVKKTAELKGKKVLLADDVLTTGSTANEAAMELKKAGCSFVGIAVFASGNGPR